MTPVRRNNGLLAAPEAAALAWLVKRVPAWATPDQLSALGVAGAGISAIGFAGTLSSRFFLLLAAVGLLANWLGDSLDGKLARERGRERKISGFMLDNGLYLVSYFLLAMGFAVSGLIQPFFPFLLLSLYVMLSNMALARLVGTGVFDLSLGSIGTTELRVIFLVVIAILAPLSNETLEYSILGYALLDVLSTFWSLAMVYVFVMTLRSDVKHG